MKSLKSQLHRAGFAASALLLIAGAAEAAPTITRLTPPSALFSFGDATPPIIARFLPGQRFDLQATINPSAGTITSVVFKVDGVVVPGTPVSANADLTATTTDSAWSLRAYSNLTPGVHTLTVEATQTDATTTTATGNFEIIGTTVQGKKAKNIIVMIGDGMGASHRTAARIVKSGIQQGKANAPLAMDLFPFTAMIQTASLNAIITDSAPGACCYSTGNKGNNNEVNVFPDDTVTTFDNPRIETMGEFLARTQGKSLGIVTTADVFDATPAAFGAHTSARGNGTGICDQYLDEMAANANLKVLLGGGRKWFLPNGSTGSARSVASDSVLPADLATAWNVPVGALDAGRDLLGNFQAAGFAYAATKSDLFNTSVVPADATKLIGLFAFSNMNIALDKINGRRGVTPSITADYGFPDQPMLDEMTDKALQVLNQNSNGFVLMVEGASIDKQAHNMDSDRWILDAVEFDYAIEKVRQFVLANPDTIAVVTADHECSGAAIIGASIVTNSVLTTRAASGAGAAQLRTGVVGTYEAAKFPNYGNPLADGYPATMDVDFKMLIGYAANADRYEDWLTNAKPLRDSQQPTAGTPYGAIVTTLPNLPTDRDTAGNFLITGQVADTSAVHTGGDIPLSAIGRGAKFFTGYMDNTDVFFKLMQAAIGGAAN